MRIGITTDIRHSAFSAGHASTSLSIAQLFKSLGHEVTLLYTVGDGWWGDIKELKDSFPCMKFEDGLKFDLVIESSFFLTPEQRGRVGPCIWYCRKPGLFTDIESSVYGKPEGRRLDGICAILTADIFTAKDDLAYFHTLYPNVPTYTVPWIWTPDIVETHRKGHPVWLQVYKSTPDTAPWSIHVTESNASSTSSCTLPLVILRHFFQTNTLEKSTRVTIHNMDHLQSSQYFKDNVLKHCSVDIEYTLLGRQRVIDWVHDPRSVVLSHNRFVDLKMANLEAVWAGIPLVHNSKILRDFGNGLEKLYYPNNSITCAAAALKTVMNATSEIPYLTDVDALTSLRKQILHKFYPLARIQEWGSVLSMVFQVAPVAAPVAAPVVRHSPTFKVLFTDMWAQFNETYNMFTLALENGIKGVQIQGYSVATLGSNLPDLVIFGPFGEEWKSLSSEWPKVHFTGENSRPIYDKSVKLNIGYELPEMSDDSYLRMPLWQFEIDWFGADPAKIRNPIPLPIDACTQTHRGTKDRPKFCAFVVTNPTNPVRNQAFLDLSTYKHVDSAGRLYNNVGSSIYAGLGGGGGEKMKYEFLKDYRFCLTYENASRPGYTTEKILHAKAAGCVPIYWGDPKVGRDFNEKGFINASGCKTAADLIQLVSSIEADPSKLEEIASVPALSSYTRDLVRRNFSEMVRRFVILANRSELAVGLPKFLGATSIHTPQPLFVTGVTLRFWPSLQMWLKALAKHLTVRPLRAQVYVGSDVPDSAINDMVKNAEYSFAQFTRFPTETPAGFSDFWEPTHYAWKLWIYNEVVSNPTNKGSLVFYMDSASVLLRWPQEWVDQTMLNGISFLEDCRQKNRNWCHSDFCSALNVTEAEKDQQQIAACLMLFVAGHPTATKLFSEALKLGQQRSIVVGKKWSGIAADGKPFGHRHDQSILSILALRLISINQDRSIFYPIDKVYGDKSARATFQNGQAVYVHRGNFQTHVPVVEGIDEAFVINLDRREDRKKSFSESNPDLKDLGVRRLAAYDGKTLELTAARARLFKPNDFFWKKAVMGCALSHLKVWSMMLEETPDIQNVLILEDDARLKTGWQEAWLTAYRSLPDDWDCVYLGGVLPPNRSAFLHTLERVGPGLARVAPNRIFGQPVETRYFHFCAYAYVLSRRGAKKILDTIQERDGYWTSADHMICNRVDLMNLYVVDPMVAGASQDDDPRYQTAEFNNFSRVDTFDSDLWNNDERFSPEEIQAKVNNDAPIQISKVFQNIDDHHSSQLNLKKSHRYLSLKTCLDNGSNLYEFKWLDELLQGFSVEPVSEEATFDKTDQLTVVLIREKWDEQLRWLSTLRKNHTFKIIHVADEYGTDPIHMYEWPEVTKVLRTYSRPDLNTSKVLVIPLGYHSQFKGSRDILLSSTPSLPFRDLMWSFVGTDWRGRSSDMVLDAVKPNYTKWFSQWKDPDQLSEDEYLALLLNSKFVPCPRGQNIETYRLYEALDCGCIPLVLDVPLIISLESKIPFIKLSSWEHAAALMKYFEENPEQMEQYRNLILVSWMNYKIELKESVRKWLV